ncbi:MAG: DALR domain-containing protein, partial [Terracidiphilus sp.]
RERLTAAKVADGESPAIEAAAKDARAGFFAGLADDLNTADALASIFELVRAANTALDSQQLFAADRDTILAVLKDFDAVFDVLEDGDAEATRKAVEWAKASGRMNEVAPELIDAQSLTDEAIDALVAERTAAKKARNFARADAIRAELAEKGVILEDSKDGVRWKRK